MSKYDYAANMEDDIFQWLEENEKTLADYEDAEELSDELWNEDSVTGNASGSYTFNRWQAEENLCHNMDLLADAAYEFGYNVVDLNNGAEFWDVIIRCYLLREVCERIFEEEEGAR